MQEPIHEMNLRHAKPRPRHSEAAPEREKKAVKKSQLATHFSNRGYAILSGDAASHILGWNTQRGWYHKYAPAMAPAALSRRRFHSVRILGNDIMHCRFYDRTGT